MEKEICEVADCHEQGLVTHEISKNTSVEFHQICKYHDKQAKEGKELNFKTSYLKR